MMIYFLAIISSFFSGMGIGGGSVFILLSLLFNLLELNEARAYNLLLFISVGIIISIKNFKKIKENKKKYIKGIIFIGIGALIGAISSKYISEKIIKIASHPMLAGSIRSRSQDRRKPEVCRQAAHGTDPHTQEACATGGSAMNASHRRAWLSLWPPPVKNVKDVFHGGRN